MAQLTDAEALHIMRGLLFGVQKARSITFENGLTEADAAMLDPWLFGPKCILPTIATIVSRFERGDEVPGGDIFNVLSLIERHSPTVLMATELHRWEIPDADIAWMAQTFRKPDVEKKPRPGLYDW